MVADTKNAYRYVARITVEAATPLTVGTGETGLDTDELVATDVNGLPCLPGTALAGVLRHLAEQELGAETVKEIFGFQERRKKDQEAAQGGGSRLVVSTARMIGADGQVLDGLQPIEWPNPFYRRFQALPVRDHCRIDYRGAADSKGHGKFDEQVVYRGARFTFEMEFIAENMEREREYWQAFLALIASPLFRIGGGTRKGFGELKVVNVAERAYDLMEPADLEAYLEKSSSLATPLAGAKTLDLSRPPTPSTGAGRWDEYILDLDPEDFFSFGAGFGDEDVDSVPKTESVITWSKNETPRFSEERILVPATSVKGALSHRIAFHYNRLTGVTVEKLAEAKRKPEDVSGENNLAVKGLFGYAKDSKARERGKSDDRGRRGRVILSDVFLEEKPENYKILNHVSIDRFTGGAVDGALFTEKVVTKAAGGFTLRILVDPEAWDAADDPDGNIRKAFEAALRDITTGMLPLGGAVMRGHGCFTGTITLNGKELK